MRGVLERARRRVLRWLAGSIALLVALSALAVLPWRWWAPPTSAFMLRHRVETGEGVRQRWVPLASMAPAVALAAVASEDQKFPTHHGFDVKSIVDAMQEDGRRRGASTISQQVAKNLYLWPGRSWVRKGLEAYFTVWIELLWPKRRILEVYLNVAEFGRGIYGVGSAAWVFFGKPVSALTRHEAALLVAVLPSPKRMSPAEPSEYVRGRALEIEAAMESLGGVGFLRRLQH
ncbi:MAG: monofunctional biosynthetic peptidoglycan transglycosylase [Proteobacteria bacterium]|nr:monofunctional biosynthetic peptidoglycan transglycosylase [Pseudomonadota bacterium]